MFEAVLVRRSFGHAGAVAKNHEVHREGEDSTSMYKLAGRAGTGGKAGRKGERCQFTGYTQTTSPARICLGKAQRFSDEAKMTCITLWLLGQFYTFNPRTQEACEKKPPCGGFSLDSYKQLRGDLAEKRQIDG